MIQGTHSAFLALKAPGAVIKEAIKYPRQLRLETSSLLPGDLTPFLTLN